MKTKIAVFLSLAVCLAASAQSPTTNPPDVRALSGIANTNFSAQIAPTNTQFAGAIDVATTATTAKWTKDGSTITNLFPAALGNPNTEFALVLAAGSTSPIGIPTSGASGASFNPSTLGLTLTGPGSFGTHVLPTNALANWPTAPATRGGAVIVNSNSVVYLLTSTPNGTAWAATNKLGP